MGFGPPPASPFELDDRDNSGSIVVSITIPYDDDAHGGTHAINGTATVFRAPGTPRTKAVVGDPQNPDHVVNIPLGTHTVTVAQMASAGLTNIDQIVNTQITFI